MEKDSGIELKTLKVDGGAVANNFLMQFQSDLLGVPVDRPEITEITALGAAYLAGLAVGFWDSKEDVVEKWSMDRQFTPVMSKEDHDSKYDGWKKAVDRSKGWEEK